MALRPARAAADSGRAGGGLAATSFMFRNLGCRRRFYNLAASRETTSFNANRAFIQFAGFTVGTAQSFFDFYQSPASSYFAPPASNTGDRGWKVFAYTVQYGNGFSATFSFEEPRNFSTVTPQSGTLNTNLGNLVLGVNTSDQDKAKVRFPDIVQNWRVDQAWG